MSGPGRQCTLRRQGDQVLLRIGDESEAVPVRIVWARPVSGRGRQVCFLDEQKREVLMIDSLDGLDPESRRVAEAELERRYLIPKITRVVRTAAHFGSRYWEVETDRGPRRFAMKDPAKNAVWISDDHLILRDTLGNRYEIPSFATLDQWSRSQVAKVL
ncbi:MAG: DUF1854 domain-containing protein [Planctomycetota bacterium]